MIACQIKDVKVFMNKLLNSEAFDKFSLETARIITYNTFEIHGRTVPEFYNGLEEKPDEIPEFSLWRDMRPICFQLIKGTRTPVSFQFTLRADTDYTLRLIKQNEIDVDPEKVSCLFVNIRFEHGTLTCITGASFTTFVADKTLEALWDTTFKKSLSTMNLNFEEL